MKVIQLNIWLGHILDAALAFVDREDPDILCAQEVNSAQNGYGLFASFQTHQRLSALFPYRFFAPTYSYEALGETVQYGNAIYSKLPLENTSVTFTVGAYKDGRTIQSRGFEIRNLQVCEVSHHGKILTIANHHGYHVSHDAASEGTDATIASMRHVAGRLRQIETPLVLCGDMNAGPASRTLAQLEPLGLRNLTVEHELTNTLSTVHRFKDVSDYIFVSPSLTVASFRATDDIVSDHKALVLTLD